MRAAKLLLESLAFMPYFSGSADSLLELGRNKKCRSLRTGTWADD